MQTSINPPIKDSPHPVTRFPSVSIILPFEPKMSRSIILSQALKCARNKVEKHLFENYAADMAALVIEKLLGIFEKLNFNTHKKSIAIYVSPVFEKILYLNMETEENISVDDSFDIKDLLSYRRECRQYTALVLSQSHSAVYAFNGDVLRRVFSSTPAQAREYTASMFNESDHSGIRFLQYTDNVLDNILKVYPYPFFILGEGEIINQFKQISHHKNAVIEYIFSNQPVIDPLTIAEILNPYVANARLLNQKKLMGWLKSVEGQGRLVMGITDVLQEVMAHKGTQLIVEKDLMCPDKRENNKIVYMKPRIYNKFSYIKDIVGYVIEKVLENGGDVEVAEKNSLKAYHHIALVK